MTKEFSSAVATPSLYQRINEVRKEVGYIKRDKEVDQGTKAGRYRAVTHDMVTAMVRESLIKHGIIILQSLISEKMVPPPPDKSMWRYEAIYRFKIVNVDDPSESVEEEFSAHAIDAGDKAPGKAASYARKTMILKLFDIETGEDDESRLEQAGDMGLADQFVDIIKAANNEDELRKAYSTALDSVTSREGQDQIIEATKNRRISLKALAAKERAEDKEGGGE